MMENSQSASGESTVVVDVNNSDADHLDCLLPRQSNLLGVNSGDANGISSFLLIGKLKSVVYEVLYNLENHGNLHNIDEFIAVTEDCLRALKTVKVERRIEARRLNVSMRNQLSSSVNVTTTPSNREGDEALIDGLRIASTAAIPGPQNYKAALLRQKRQSPKRSPVRSDAQTRGEVEAARHAAALRAEERQRQAEERRFDHLQEIKQRSEVADARSFRAKMRREEAEEKQRVETQGRMENGVRRAEEARRHTREKAQRAHTRVEEVLLTKELQQQNKALLLDKKMSDVEHNQEQMRERLQKQVQERQEAMRAAAERRRNLSQERQERQQMREQHRVDNLRRVDEQKKVDQEVKQQKAREWEKKVHQHHVDATAEAEAQSRKTEEKFQQSAQLLEEQREKRQQKLDRQEQKLREAKERRDKELEERPTLEMMMPRLSEQEVEQQASRVLRLSTTAAHHGKVFADTYQRMSTKLTKDLNRSRLRVVFSRLASSVSTPSLVQCKHLLSDITAAPLGDMDYEFVRYFNSFEILIKVIAEARKARDFGVIRQVTDVLLSLFADEQEGRENVMYFIKSGCAVSLMLCLREEASTLRPQNNSEALRCTMQILGMCLERISTDGQGGAKWATVRDQLLNEMDVIGIDRVCVAVLQTSAEEDELQLAYIALCIIYAELIIITRRRAEPKRHWFQQITTSLFALLQNMLTPNGSPLGKGDGSLSSERVTILFCLFRTLNTLARWQLTQFQELLHDGSTDAGAAVDAMQEKKGYTKRSASVDSPPPLITRTELFHVLNGFFMFIHGHLDNLETIPYSESAAGTIDKNENASFAEALQFGITLSSFPAFPSSGSGSQVGDGQKLGTQSNHLRATLHECILFIGYLCFDDAPLQDMMGWGKEKPLLGTMLSVLPIAYFSNARHILFPTILSAILQNNRNSMIVREEMSLAELQDFISQEYGPLTKRAKMYAQEHHKQLVAHKMETDPRFALMVKLQGKSWADMADDDDSPPMTPRSSETTSTTPAMEKEKLCKGLRATSLNPSNYYKLERRLPISYWPAAIEQLEKLRHL
ncbi:hypothetical protein JKF63_07311 [Porcisia hertigi]|uniref:S phase cyclin A-associated protein in the endoplasmic reticulum n=1 Tax=Porcisia hertigi TaxID=2761500 RepID=A0A837A995_9TRYP|nr:hypothetical protein JKF63_07311 [Porcisia hertigi]